MNTTKTNTNKTSESHESVHRLVNGKEKQNTSCICFRPCGIVCCLKCDFNGLGRVKLPCPIHKTSVYLMEIEKCPKCKSECHEVSYLAEEACFKNNNNISHVDLELASNKKSNIEEEKVKKRTFLGAGLGIKKFPLINQKPVISKTVDGNNSIINEIASDLNKYNYSLQDLENVFKNNLNLDTTCNNITKMKNVFKFKSLTRNHDSESAVTVIKRNYEIKNNALNETEFVNKNAIPTINSSSISVTPNVQNISRKKFFKKTSPTLLQQVLIKQACKVQYENLQ